MSSTVFNASTSELATLGNTFTVSGTPTDPTTLTLTITSPSQTVTAYTYAASQITRTSAGLYTKDVACPEAGTWQYQWVGTGAASDATAGTWEVQETTLGNLYATIEALKSRLSIPSTDTADDYELHQACFAASRAIEHYCQRTFWRTAAGTARTFVPEDSDCLAFGPFCDLVTATAVKTDDDADGAFETTWSTSDYYLTPRNPTAAPEQLPYTGIRIVTRLFPALRYACRDDLVQVTGTWGWPTVPYGIRQAALIAAAEAFKLKDAPAGGIAGMGDFGVVRIRANPQVAGFAGPYRLYPGGVA
jgi:hypothetical protein